MAREAHSAWMTATWRMKSERKVVQTRSQEGMTSNTMRTSGCVPVDDLSSPVIPMEQCTHSRSILPLSLGTIPTALTYWTRASPSTRRRDICLSDEINCTDSTRGGCQHAAAGTGVGVETED